MTHSRSRLVPDSHPPFRLGVSLVSLVLLSSCYTTTNTATLSPLRTNYPVSASGQFVDNAGNVVTEDQYTVVKSFEFDREVKGARHEVTETSLELQPELDRILAEAQGDAITDVSVIATDYDSGSHGSSAGWKIMGWTLGLTGAPFLVIGAASGDDDLSTFFLTFGGIMTGLGVGSYLIGTTANDPSSWKIHVKGQVVKRTEAPTTPALPASGTAPESEGSPAPPAQAPAVVPDAVPVPEAPPPGSLYVPYRSDWIANNSSP